MPRRWTRSGRRRDDDRRRRRHDRGLQGLHLYAVRVRRDRRLTSCTGDSDCAYRELLQLERCVPTLAIGTACTDTNRVHQQPSACSASAAMWRVLARARRARQEPVANVAVRATTATCNGANACNASGACLHRGRRYLHDDCGLRQQRCRAIGCWLRRPGLLHVTYLKQVARCVQHDGHALSGRALAAGLGAIACVFFCLIAREIDGRSKGATGRRCPGAESLRRTCSAFISSPRSRTTRGARCPATGSTSVATRTASTGWKPPRARCSGTEHGRSGFPPLPAASPRQS